MGDFSHGQQCEHPLSKALEGFARNKIYFKQIFLKRRPQTDFYC